MPKPNIKKELIMEIKSRYVKAFSIGSEYKKFKMNATLLFIKSIFINVITGDSTVVK